MAERDMFGRYWAAVAAGSVGGAVITVAMPVLVVTALRATPTEVGLVAAIQVLPYAVLGLFAGVAVDRMRRRPILIVATAIRAVCIALVPALWALGVLSVGMLMAVLCVAGCASVFGSAATQSLLPRIVPRERLVAANARLDQTDAAAQTAGPAAGGALVAVLGAPLSFGVSAAAVAAEVVMLFRVRVVEPPRSMGRSRIRADIAAGLRWAYGHAVLGPLAVSTHVWFIANAAGVTALSLLALRELAIGPLWFGIVTAVGGVAMLLGASVATRLGRTWGSGRTILVMRALYPVGWFAVIVLASITPALEVAVPVLTLALALTGFAGGAENANEMGIRQGVTPDGLLGRTNATMRSANRTFAALGAAGAGVAITLVGTLPTLVAVGALFLIAAAIAARRPVRTARLG